MAQRSMFKGALTFGMVSAPVKAYAATEDREFHLNQMHKTCGTRVSMPKMCLACQRAVAPEEITKGYQVSEGQYLVLSDEDLAALPLKTMHAIEVVAFVPAGSIADPRCMEKPYYIAPDKGGEKVLGLLTAAMTEAHKDAVGKWAVRNREHLVLIRPQGGVLALYTLRLADEVRDPDELPQVKAGFSPKELELAKMLVAHMSQEQFDLAGYEDAYRKALQELIERKLAGEILTPIVAETPKTVSDLSDSLAASLAAMGVMV